MAGERQFIEQLHASYFPRIRPQERWRRFTIEWLDLKRIKLAFGSLVPVVWCEEKDVRVQEDLLELTREKTSTSPTIFLDQEPSVRPSFDPADLKLHSLGLLSPTVRASFIEARDHDRRYQILGEALAKDIGAGALSPYVSGKPASGAKFFGRSRVLEQVVSGKLVRNCTIVGNRRIGKTSLLHEIEVRLSEIYVPGQTIHFAKLYSSKLKTTWDAVYLTLTQLGIQVPKGWTKLGAIAPRYINRFPQLIHDFARQRQTYVVLLIDEFDSFLAIDSHNNWEFLHLLREAAAEDDRFAVVIAGFRILMQTRERQNNPYYNFTREIALTPLSKEETFDMVQVPLRRLGIDVSNTNIPMLIHRETRGQPELIQMYCSAIIALYERKGSAPSDTELSTYVNRDQTFSRTILHTFLKNANPIEQTLCFQLMKRSTDGSAHFEFRASDADEALANLGLRVGNAELSTLLNNLVVGSFIERVGGAPGQYRFAVPQLVRYCHNVNLDQLLSKALADTRVIGVAEALTLERPELT
jgi:hypothetical protein